jgi:hypothetical protein
MSNKNCCKKCCKKYKNLNVSKKIDQKVVSNTYILKKHWKPEDIYIDLKNGSGDFSLTTYSTADNDNIDLTSGITTYINNENSNFQDMIELTNNNQVLILRTKQYTINKKEIYKSIRMVSSASYKKGLFVISVLHIPTGPGIWPSWWLAPLDWTIWPKGGEIDIIEGVNAGAINIPDKSYISNDNKGALHTIPGCPSGTGPNEGCNFNKGYVGCGKSFEKADGRSFGVRFNNEQRGGVYVCELTDQGQVRIWFFQNGYNNVPDYFNNTADTSSITDEEINKWSKDSGKFVEFAACPGYFDNLVMTLNTAVCGDWPNGGFSNKNNEGCKAYINKSGGISSEAYWSIQYIRYYNN